MCCNKNSLYIVILSLSILISCGTEEPRKVMSFNDDWTFHLGDVPEAKNKDYDDSSWRKLYLPHDWAIEGEFSADNPSGAEGGALPGGVGWYRKIFNIDKSYEGNRVFIDFDGVYMNSDVWINGVHLGVRPFGYISFRYDITKYLSFDSDNIVAVRVDNSNQPNSRWYSGCGIYRNVWLSIVNPVHVDLWGTYVTTPYITEQKALVEISTTINNEMLIDADVKLETIIQDVEGTKVISGNTEYIISAQASNIFEQSLEVINPILWTLENPYLYEVITKVYANGKYVDSYKTPLGIRYFEFDATKGFILNGEQTKIKGVCMHHDLGSLGASINTRAIERQLEILKDMGVNSIRTAHNPPAPELLHLCDKMGIIVQNETFDTWRKRKTTYDYSNYFNEWYERDLRDHILRDRNHPSVFMWSIGNEVLEQWTHADADTLSLKQANILLNFKRDIDSFSSEDSMNVNALLTRKMVDIVKEIDPTRPVTAGNNESRQFNNLLQSNALDIIGINYNLDDYENVASTYPDKPFLASETTSALATRGYYRMPSDSSFIWPIRWDVPFYEASFACSSYDNNHVPWGTTHERTWKKVKENDFVSGIYVWTGFDYLGEPTPFGFPARSSYFGLVDLAGFPKDSYYMYQSEWTNKEMLHVFPHWNWNVGQEIDIWAYYNEADEAELFLNNVSQGVKFKDDSTYHVSWRLKYEPGTIKVVTRKNGNEVIRKEIHTAGDPYQIRLTPDRQIISKDRDLSFITVEVLDKNGNICPNSDNLINFEINGEGTIVGVDNGNQISMESFKKPMRKAFHGKCLVIIESNRKLGGINLVASSDNLESDEVSIIVR